MSKLSFTRENIMKVCLSVLAERRLGIERDLNDITDSASTETKSSVGDKHETARARMQEEQARLQQQFHEIKTQEAELEKIRQINIEEKVSQGSVVFTNLGVFFIAIALGKLRLGQDHIQVVSARSPLVLKMIGLKAGDAFELNGTSYFIKSVK